MADADDTGEGVTTWPPHYEADVVTADGGVVHVRPITPADADRLVAFHERQSPESIYFRYFSARPRLSAADIRRFTHVDMSSRVAFIALVDDVLIGVGRYDRYPSGTEAEVAFFIDDAHHGRGLATIMLEYLAAAGRENGVEAFVASVLPNNRAMLSVFMSAGFQAASRFADGVVEVRFEIAATPESTAAVEERAVRAEARTVARLMEPRTIAVIGAGRRAETVGHEVLRQLLAHDFAGEVYAVNREASEVAGVQAWPSVIEVPATIDVAVVAVPADEVLGAVDDCARARVGALVVVSTGFGEDGDEGVVRARELVQRARQYGIRLLGPGSLGVINTDPQVRLHASFSPVSPVAGRVALSLQSGTLGAGILRRATARGLGFSSIAAVGDKLDVSGNDLLAWWESDERTDVIAMSLASYGNPRRFRRLAPRVGRKKPIVAMVREPTEDDDALLAQTGVVGVDTLDEMIAVSGLLASQPVPQGGRVGVVAESVGSLQFAVAACTGVGLDVAATRVLPPDAEPSAYGDALREVLEAGSPAVDAALVLYAASLAPRPNEVARSVANAAAAVQAVTPKPVLAAFPGIDLGGRLPEVDGRTVPDFGFPDNAARALAAAVRYGRWRALPVGEVRDLPDVDLAAIRELVRGWVTGDGRLLDLRERASLLAAAGIEVVPQQVAASAEEASDLAAAVGAPVALKAVGRHAVAKSEAWGVALDLQTPEAVATSWDRMAATLGPAMTAGIVQPMVSPGIDVRVVLEPAPVVGAAVGLGLGGALPDHLVSLVRAVPPLTDAVASDLVDRAGLGELLGDDGVEALCDLLQRVSLLSDVPEIDELLLNPVIVSDGRAWVVDATAEVRPESARVPDDLRRLDG